MLIFIPADLSCAFGASAQVCFPGEADMNWRQEPAESVENDPMPTWGLSVGSAMHC